MRKISTISKRRLLIFGVLSVIAVFYFSITLISYTYNYISLKNEERNLNKQLISLQDQKANLKIEIQKLNDPEYVIRYAKENYLYSEDGEYVLKIDDSPSITQTVNNKNNYYFLIGMAFLLVIIITIKIKKKEKN